MTLDEFASRLQKAKPKTINGRWPGFIGCCPAHDDKVPSFAVWQSDDDWLHVKCKAGCSEKAILGAMGLSDDDRRVCLNGQAPPKAEIVYAYTDADGRYLFEKVRQGHGKSKRIWQRIRLGEGGMVNSLEQLGGKAKVLYRLPEVLGGIEAKRPVWFNEGEKAVEAFRAKGEVATCQHLGAEREPSSIWSPLYTGWLTEADLVIVADKDEVGESYAKWVAATVRATCSTVRIVQSKTGKEHDDAYDHFAAGGTLEDFVDRSDLLPQRKPAKGKKFDGGSFVPVDVGYLWEPRMPRGKIILWDADGGTQKTSLLLAMAAGFSVGQLPLGEGPCPVIRTAYFHHGEDDDEELATVFCANGGDLDQIEFFGDPTFQLGPEGLDVLETTIKQGGFLNVVFDAMIYFCQYLRHEGWKDPMAILPVLEGLKRVAKRTDVVINDVRHTSKGTVGKAASELGFGSVQFRNSHRGQQVLRYHPEEKGLVIVTDEKGSLLVPRAEAFAFRRMGNAIEYVHDFDNPFDKDDTSQMRQAMNTLAKDWLANELTRGPRQAKEIIEAGRAKNLHDRTLRRALKALGGISERVGFGPGSECIWLIPCGSSEVSDEFDAFSEP